MNEIDALKAHINELEYVLSLAVASHGRMLMSDPPQYSWKFYKVEERANYVLRNSPETSLAEHDSRQRLDELEALMTLVEPPDPETSLASAFEKIEERIKSLRQIIGKL